MVAGASWVSSTAEFIDIPLRWSHAAGPGVCISQIAARTRAGAPEPPMRGSTPTKISAPRGGTCSRFVRPSRCRSLREEACPRRGEPGAADLRPPRLSCHSSLLRRSRRLTCRCSRHLQFPKPNRPTSRRCSREHHIGNVYHHYCSEKGIPVPPVEGVYKRWFLGRQKALIRPLEGEEPP